MADPETPKLQTVRSLTYLFENSLGHMPEEKEPRTDRPVIADNNEDQEVNNIFPAEEDVSIDFPAEAANFYSEYASDTSILFEDTVCDISDLEDKHEASQEERAKDPDSSDCVQDQIHAQKGSTESQFEDAGVKSNGGNVTYKNLERGNSEALPVSDHQMTIENGTILKNYQGQYTQDNDQENGQYASLEPSGNVQLPRTPRKLPRIPHQNNDFEISDARVPVEGSSQNGPVQNVTVRTVKKKKTLKDNIPDKASAQLKTTKEQFIQATEMHDQCFQSGLQIHMNKVQNCERPKTPKKEKMYASCENLSMGGMQYLPPGNPNGQDCERPKTQKKKKMYGSCGNLSVAGLQYSLPRNPNAQYCEMPNTPQQNPHSRQGIANAEYQNVATNNFQYLPPIAESQTANVQLTKRPKTPKKELLRASCENLASCGLSYLPPGVPVQNTDFYANARPKTAPNYWPKTPNNQIHGMPYENFQTPENANFQCLPPINSTVNQQVDKRPITPKKQLMQNAIHGSYENLLDGQHFAPHGQIQNAQVPADALLQRRKALKSRSHENILDESPAENRAENNPYRGADYQYQNVKHRPYVSNRRQTMSTVLPVAHTRYPAQNGLSVAPLPAARNQQYVPSTNRENSQEFKIQQNNQPETSNQTVPHTISPSINDYNVGEKLGIGGFAKVYQAVHKATGREVAIKMIDIKKMKAQKMESRVHNEIKIHQQVQHPSILKLYSHFRDEKHVYLVLELCKDEFTKFVRARGSLPENEVRGYMMQVVNGLIYLHSNNIMHRDFSLANLLLTKDNKVKIADFGLATSAGSQERHMTLCGTPNYISPEIASQREHGLYTDVWSVGCMLYYMLVGRPPFDTPGGVHNTLKKVKEAKYDLPTHLSPEARDLIVQLLKKDPAERIQPHKILEHPFMTKRPLVSPHSDASVDSAFSNDSYRSSASSNSTGSHHNHPHSHPHHHQPCISGKYHRQHGGDVAHNPLESLREASVDSGVSNPAYGGAGSGSGAGGAMRVPMMTQSGGEPYHQHQSQNQNQHNMRIAPGGSQRQRSASADTRKRPKSAGYRQPSKPVFPGPQNTVPRPKTAGYPLPPPSPQLLTNTAPNQCFQQQQTPMNGLQSQTNQLKCKSMEYLNAGNATDTDSGIERSRSRQRPPKILPADLPAPLTTTRLKPIRKEGSRGNNCFYILEDGWVVLEFIKQRPNPNGGQSRYVTEVFKVSSDGMKIISYAPFKALVSDTPAPEPMDMSKVRVFDYVDLPEKLWKKYRYISNFINMVKGKTPKVTKYTQDQQAKCLLMENANFEVHFYDGAKFHFVPDTDTLSIINKDGATIPIGSTKDVDRLKPDAQKYWKLAMEYRESCLRWEECIAEIEEKLNERGFPFSYGRRPEKKIPDAEDTPTATKPSALPGAYTSNNSPSTVMAPSVNMRSFDGTVLSQGSPSSNVSCQTQVPQHHHRHQSGSRQHHQSHQQQEHFGTQTPQQQWQQQQQQQWQQQGTTPTAFTSQPQQQQQQQYPATSLPPRPKTTNPTTNSNSRRRDNPSPNRAAPGASKVQYKVHDVAVGWAMQMSSGDVVVCFADGTELTILYHSMGPHSPLRLRYADVTGRATEYSGGLPLPDEVKEKLSRAMSMIPKLKQAQPKG